MKKIVVLLLGVLFIHASHADEMGLEANKSNETTAKYKELALTTGVASVFIAGMDFSFKKIEANLANFRQILSELGVEASKKPTWEIVANKSLTRLLQGAGVINAAVAGYSAGVLLVDYDKNHWDGKMVKTVSEYGEPIFSGVYKLQTSAERGIDKFKGSSEKIAGTN